MSPAASEGLPIYMVVESMSIHAAAEVVEWPERRDMGLPLLPTYSPKLNPAELVRSLVKGAVGKQFVKTKSDLKKRIVEQFDALRAVPEKVQMVFHEPDCNYIVSGIKPRFGQLEPAMADQTAPIWRQFHRLTAEMTIL